MHATNEVRLAERIRAFRWAAAVAIGLVLMGLALLASGCGSGPSATQQRQYSIQVRKLTQCMRSHGIKNFQMTGTFKNTPRYQAAQTACQHFLPVHPTGQ